jgi:hypothetical protein
MYECDNNECNTVREPVCGRGGSVTSNSVTGTGPGSSCLPEPEPDPEPTPPLKKGCRVHVVSKNRHNYLASKNSVSVKVC